MGNSIIFVGLDASLETIDVSVDEEGRQGEIRRLGQIAYDMSAVHRQSILFILVLSLNVWKVARMSV